MGYTQRINTVWVGGWDRAMRTCEPIEYRFRTREPRVMGNGTARTSRQRIPNTGKTIKDISGASSNGAV